MTFLFLCSILMFGALAYGYGSSRLGNKRASLIAGLCGLAACKICFITLVREWSLSDGPAANVTGFLTLLALMGVLVISFKCMDQSFPDHAKDQPVAATRPIWYFAQPDVACNGRCGRLIAASHKYCEVCSMRHQKCQQCGKDKDR